MRKIKNLITMCASLAAIALIVVACTGGLDIQQSYKFDVETMPYQNSLADGGTAEIRCSLVREGNFTGTRYRIRYFQSDGRGELRLDDGTLLSPNDDFPLEKRQFRLYYTSRCREQQIIDVWIEDNFGQVVQKSFSWRNEEPDNDETNQ